MTKSIDTDTRQRWYLRGVRDADRGRSALMRPTRSGVAFDIEPPAHFDDDYTPAEQLEIARCYWQGHLTGGAS